MRPRDTFWTFCWFALASALAVAPRPARADVTAAAKAFAEGQAAQLEGNYARAAERFELAFSLQPSKEALRSAARMHMSAGNLARAATDAEMLLERFGDDAESAELGRSILDEVAPGLARYEVSCAPECALSIDGLAYFVEPARRHRLYLNPGRVSVEAHFRSGRTAARKVSTAASETTRIELAEPAAPHAPAVHATLAPSPVRGKSERAHTGTVEDASTHSSGVPVVVPWLTGAATVACGAVTLWAGLDTRRLHEEYVEHPTDAKWNEGVARQRLTNVLAASTAVLGAATVTLALFVGRREPRAGSSPSGSQKPSVGVSPSLGPRSASVALAGQF